MSLSILDIGSMIKDMEKDTTKRDQLNIIIILIIMDLMGLYSMKETGKEMNSKEKEKLFLEMEDIILGTSLLEGCVLWYLN